MIDQVTRFARPVPLRGARGVACAVLLALVGWPLAAASVACAANHPFAAHGFSYAPGAILPGHVGQAELDQAVRDFYDAWKARYLEQTCGPGRWVVRTSVRSGNLTVSEGHGYGMMIAALMAGHDPDAQAIFDGMLAYFHEHPTASHDRLMAWYQNASCSDAQGDESASDGDLDIAFALLLADKQWGSCGAIDYLAEARRVIADIRHGDVEAAAGWVLLGSWVDPGDTTYHPATRSSDFMPDHLRSFAAATGDADWTELLDRGYAMVSALQANHAPATGLLPDFVRDPVADPRPVAPYFLEGPNDGAYGYNACRDPWRIATDYLASGDARARAAMQRLGTWIRAATTGDPSRIRSGYRLDGTPSPGSDYLSMAFVAPLGVAAMADGSSQQWLDDLWDLIVATPLDAEGYYENTLKLLAMIAISGNWWVPEAVAGGCSPQGTPQCTSGALVPTARIVVGLGSPAPGDETLLFDGTLLFPQGLPAAPLSAGAQLLVEDLGSGGTALLDLTTATHPIPGSDAGACDPGRDGWRTTPALTRYRNGSGALDPPACTAGSAAGLGVLRFQPRSGFDLHFTARTRRSTIVTPVGPLRGTIVLDDTDAAGDAGACGVSAALSCSASGRTLRCR